MDYSPPGSHACGILQARILESVTITSSRQSSWPKDWTHVSYISCIGKQFFTTEPPGKPSKPLGTILVVCIHGHYISVKYTNVIYFSYNALILPSLSASLSPSSPFILHRWRGHMISRIQVWASWIHHTFSLGLEVKINVAWVRVV